MSDKKRKAESIHSVEEKKQKMTASPKQTLASHLFQSLEENKMEPFFKETILEETKETKQEEQIEQLPDLDTEQQKILDMILTGKNVFLTGAAGTGKSVLLKHAIKKLKEKCKQVAVVATTGLAAHHLNGQTIHSFAGIGLGNDDVYELIHVVSTNHKAQTNWMYTDVLILDELSMCSALLLIQLEHLARVFRKSSLPFGGMQLIFCGDFCQLPPVNPERVPPLRPGQAPTPKHLKSMYAFEAPCFKELFEDRVYELTKIYRQADPEFQLVLSSIRKYGAHTPLNILQLLKKRCCRPLPCDDGILPTVLYMKNADVNKMNNDELQKLPGPSKIFEPKYTPGLHKNSAFEIEKLKKDDEKQGVAKLELRIGAQVMYLENTGGSLFNGTRGVVVEFKGDYCVLIKLTNGQTVPVYPLMKDVKKDGKVVAIREAMPLKHAWAMTVHKSQGSTLDKVQIKISDAFCSGAAYTALSRARTMDGLHIVGEVSPRFFFFDRIVQTFYEEIAA